MTMKIPSLILTLVGVAWTAMIVSVAASAPASAQAPSAGQAGEHPISITADRMEADDRDKVVTFTGNVVARQKELVLNCQVMKVFYQRVKSEPDEAGGDPAGTGPARRAGGRGDLAEVLGDDSNEIEKVECLGGVKITQGDKVAVAEKAVYLAKAKPRTIVMTGEPRLWRDKDYLTGMKITYFLDENRSVVEGGGRDRVNAIFYQSAPDKTMNQRNRPEPGAQPVRPGGQGSRP
ncbi:MAG: LptA/OstA family protein [Thermodesulfobacteriota bacterium]